MKVSLRLSFFGKVSQGYTRCYEGLRLKVAGSYHLINHLPRRQQDHRHANTFHHFIWRTSKIPETHTTMAAESIFTWTNSGHEETSVPGTSPQAPSSRHTPYEVDEFHPNPPTYPAWNLRCSFLTADNGMERSPKALGSRWVFLALAILAIVKPHLGNDISFGHFWTPKD